MTEPYWSGDGITLYLGDCRTILPTLPAADAVVTDPPYELGFMGKRWDASGIAYDVTVWAECLRVLKPGGYLMAFGGTRTYHRMACAIEDAGFEIRDSLHWLYGSGFPKGKACLKPGHEPIVLARKPARGVVPLNIDACRVVNGTPVETARGTRRTGGIMGTSERNNGPRWETSNAGRWPPNVLLTHADGCQPTGTRRVRANGDGGGMARSGYEGGNRRPGKGHGGPDGMETVEAWNCAPGCPVAGLDAQSGVLASSLRAKGYDTPATNRVYSDLVRSRANPGNTYGDTGGASRFFPVFRYEAKAPTSERPRLSDGTAHPTVKPLALMRWLVRLVTPPSSLVLDPFCGTGTTLQAARLEGFQAAGIDSDPRSVELAAHRLSQGILVA